MRLSRSAGWVVVCLPLVSISAFAQDRTGPRVDFNADAFGGWAVDRQWLTEPTGDRTLTNEGTTGGGNFTVYAQLPRERFDVNASGYASTRWFAPAEGIATGYGGTVRVGSAGNRRWSWEVLEGLNYDPVNALAFLPGGGVTAGVPIIDYRLSNQRQLASNTNGSIGYRLSRRQQLSFEGSYGLIDFPSEFGGDLWHRWTAGGRYTWDITRYLAFYAGYSQMRGSGGVLEPQNAPELVPPSETSATLEGGPAPSEAIQVVHGMDVGLAYNRSLSISRRTRVSARLGTGAIDNGESLQYTVTGNGELTHQIGRTWQMLAAVDRSVRFVQFTPIPSIVDSVAVSVAGRVTQGSAIQFQADAGRTDDPSQFAQTDLRSVSAAVQYRVSLRDRLAFFTEYFFVESEWAGALEAIDGQASRLRRHGVQVGLSYGTGILGPRR